MKTSKIFNTGIIGFGMAGQFFHAPFIETSKGFNLKKISTRNPQSREKAKLIYPNAELVDTADDIINDPSIDMVVVASPNKTHYELTKAALLAGKHVVVDKPFTSTTKEADELIALSKKMGRVLAVYQNRRFTSDFRTVTKILESGILGRLVDYNVNYHLYRPALRENSWKEVDEAGTGILYDLGSHIIDQALILFGMPQTVTANIQKQRTGTFIDDYFRITLQYSGLSVNLNASYLTRKPGPTFELHGEKGSFVKYGMDIQEDTLKQEKMPDSPLWGKEPDEIQGTLVAEINGLPFTAKVQSECGNYGDLFKNVYEAITGQGELIVKPELSRNNIYIIELATQSSKEKRTITL